MSPSLFSKEEYEKTRDEMAVGSLNMGGGIHLTWDFRELLAETRRRELLTERGACHVTKSGRIIMPVLGII